MIRNVTCQHELEGAFKLVKSGDVLAIQNKGAPYTGTPTAAVAESPEGAAFSLRNKNGVEIIGLGNPVIQLTAHGSGLLIQNCNDCTVEGVTFKGLGPLRGEPNELSFALVQFHGVNTRATLKDCVFLNSGNHGIAHLWGPRTTSNSRFYRNHFENCGNYTRKNLFYDGAAISVGGDGITSDSNTIFNCLRGIEHENSLTSSDGSHVMITNNRILCCPWQSILVTPDSGMPGSPAFDAITVSGNTIVGTGKPVGTLSNTGIYVSGATAMMITGNQVSNIAQGCGILLTAEHSDILDCLVVGNIVRDCDATGIQLSPGALGKCYDNAVRGNELRNIMGRGIYLDCANSDISDNSVMDCDYEPYYDVPAPIEVPREPNRYTNNSWSRCKLKPVMPGEIA